MGIEPTRPAWKAGILPLNYTRIFCDTDDYSTEGSVRQPVFFYFFAYFSRRAPFLFPTAEVFKFCFRV